MKDKKEKEKAKELHQEETEAGAAQSAEADAIAALQKELAQWKEKTYRTVADCDNLRKSYEKDHQLMVKYRGQPFVEKLLPTLDSFYLVLKVTPEDPMLKNYLVGFQMIYNGMIQALQEEGVEQLMPPLGAVFDHNTMQAIDVKEGEEDDIVVDISKPGYMLRDRLVRPAMVVVSKKKTEKLETEETASEEKGE